MAKIDKIEVSSVLNKIMKKCKLVIKILIVIFTFYFTANYIKNSSREAYFYDELAKKYKNNEQKFLLKDLTNFKWDNVKAYTSYSPCEEESYLKFYRYGIKVAKIMASSELFQKKVTGEKYSCIWFYDKRFEKFGKLANSENRNKSNFNYNSSLDVLLLDFMLSEESNEFIYSGGPDYIKEKLFDMGNSESIFVETRYKKGDLGGYSGFYYFDINN